jgi:mannosyltransferase
LSGPNSGSSDEARDDARRAAHAPHAGRQGRPWQALVGITVLGAVLRFSTLGRQSFWFDEAVTVNLVRSSLRGMLDALPRTETTPPLFYVVAWLWSRVFGTSEIGLRSLSALVGTAAIPVAFAAARELVSTRAALLTAGLVATSPLLVWYSDEARSYSLLVLTSALSVFLFARALRNPSRVRLLGWVVACVLAIWTHYFAIFLVASEVSLLLVRSATRRATLVCAAGIGLATAALVPLVRRQEEAGHAAWIAQEPLGQRAREVVHQGLLGVLPLAHVGWLVGGLCLVLLSFLAFVSTAEERAGARTAGLLAVGCLALPLLAALVGKDYWFYRNLIGGWIPLAIVLAAGLASVRSRVVGPALGVALIALSAAVTVITLSRHSLQRDDWRGLANCLGARQPTRALVLAPGYERIALGLYRPGLREMRLGGSVISEIDFVRGLPERSRVPRGFSPLGRSCLHSIPVVRFRATRSRRLTPAEVVAESSGATVVTDGGDRVTH